MHFYEWYQKKKRKRDVCQPGGGGGGGGGGVGYSDMFIGSGYFLGVQNFEFQYFWGFSGN